MRDQNQFGAVLAGSAKTLLCVSTVFISLFLALIFSARSIDIRLSCSLGSYRDLRNFRDRFYNDIDTIASWIGLHEFCLIFWIVSNINLSNTRKANRKCRDT